MQGTLGISSVAIRALVVGSVLGLGPAGTCAVGAVQPPASAPPAKAPAVTGDGPEVVTKERFIAGTMDIDFGTRTNMDTTGDLRKGSAALGARDTYKFTMNVAETLEFAGTITRQPSLYSSILGRRQQEALLTYSVDLSVLNPRDLKQKRAVGKWVGTVPIDPATGQFDLAGGRAKDSPLRISVDAIGRAAAFQDNFSGRLVGKAEKKEGLVSYTFNRIIGDKTVKVVVKKSDPMRFENLVLGKGPTETYPRTTVNGRLDYDYETGNWLTDGIRFTYSLDGRDYEDIVTGSIKWVEDPDRKSNGKGHYEFNLRFNEAKNKKAAGEGAAFDKMSDEEAFFAVDDSIPCLTGRVSYIDTMNGDTVTNSKVTYSLNANKLTKQQAVNFFKLWMVCVGPTNDE